MLSTSTILKICKIIIEELEPSETVETTSAAPTKKRGRPPAKAKAKPTPLEIAEAAAPPESAVTFSAKEAQAEISSGLASQKYTVDNVLAECKAAGISTVSQITDVFSTQFILNLRARQNENLQQ